MSLLSLGPSSVVNHWIVNNITVHSCSGTAALFQSLCVGRAHERAPRVVSHNAANVHLHAFDRIRVEMYTHVIWSCTFFLCCVCSLFRWVCVSLMLRAALQRCSGCSSQSCCSRCRWILAAYILSVYSVSVVSDKCRHRTAKSHIHTKVPSQTLILPPSISVICSLALPRYQTTMFVTERPRVPKQLLWWLQLTLHRTFIVARSADGNPFLPWSLPTRHWSMQQVLFHLMEFAGIRPTLGLLSSSNAVCRICISGML